MKAWFIHHLHSLKTALAQFQAAPLATLFTVLVIGVAVALPLVLYVLLGNLERAAGGVKPQTEMTLFLKPAATESEARALLKTLQADAGIGAARLVTREEALRALESAGLADIVAGLPRNPLPNSLVIHPRAEGSAAVAALAERLRTLPLADRLLMDATWNTRLEALMRLGEQLVFLLAAMLGLALAAITGNTIRLQIYAQRDEIEVARLIGATERFIRRPYLYFGSVQGLAGGIAGWGLVMLCLGLLQSSVSGVAAAYGGAFELSGLSLAELLWALLLCAGLGWLGAYFAVGQTLRRVDAR